MSSPAAGPVNTSAKPSRNHRLGFTYAKTLEQVGQSFDPPISREMVRQIEIKALNKLWKRYPVFLRFLQEEYEDWRASQPWNPEPDFFDGDSSEDEEDEMPEAA